VLPHRDARTRCVLLVVVDLHHRGVGGVGLHGCTFHQRKHVMEQSLISAIGGSGLDLGLRLCGPKHLHGAHRGRVGGEYRSDADPAVGHETQDVATADRRVRLAACDRVCVSVLRIRVFDRFCR